MKEWRKKKLTRTRLKRVLRQQEKDEEKGKVTRNKQLQ